MNYWSITLIDTEDSLHPLKRLALQNMSYSRISTFEWCKLKYYYSYIVQVPQTYGPPAVLGNIIHKALEVTLENEEEINTLELLKNYRDALNYYDPNEEIPRQMVQDGEDMLIDFANVNSGPIEITEKELPFSFVLDNARINGFIDAIVVKDDKVKIIDYKTGKRQITKKETPTNVQLGIYSLYMNYLYPDKDIEAELYYLRSNATRGHLFTKEHLEDVEVNIKEKISEILSTENFLPTPNERNCMYCSYASDGTCPAGVKRLKKFQ
jgi:CRISPR/Cas system-associated exonuclease Cas4 (RecB family)